MLVVSSNLLRAVHTALLLKEGKSKVPRVSRALQLSSWRMVMIFIDTYTL
jgi:hypothetical protein